ncbi:MAG TPA: hypothetical protein VGG75_42590 [Trebonia sp.]|jgi:hypothetical protein
MADDPAATFADLMNSAAESAAEEAAEAPYGYTQDRETGELRPKRTAGRPRKQRSLDEMKAAKAEEEPEPEERPADRAPSAPKRGRRGRAKAEASPPQPTPQFREGQISKGINKLYRKTGKILKVWDPVIGAAVIESTRKDEDDDITVGEAWEELARTNVRIRRFLLSVMTGGAWGALFMAHAPIVLAVLMKDSIQKRLPFAKLLGALFSRDDDDQGDEDGGGSPLDGLQAEDLDAMMTAASQMMGQMMGGRGFTMPRTVPGDVVSEEPAA